MPNIVIPFFTPARCVLLLGDEAVHIYDMGARRVRLLDSIPWEAKTFEAAVASAIAQDCGGKPVVILNDMVEQHYRKERIPKVSPLDKAQVIQNRLQVAFNNYPIRASLALKEKPAKVVQSDEEQQKGFGGIYLFAAVPMTEHFLKVMEAVKRSLAPIAGFVLLPVESADMVKALTSKLVKKDQNKSQWSIFIGQHQNGGLRQIVTRNGELALTRLTPIVDTDIEPAMWAREIAHEFKSTMSYLTRFGFTKDDGLETIVISNPGPAEHLRRELEGQTKLHVLHAREAASKLGINIGRQEDLRYADPLHAAWAARKQTFIMPMKAKQIGAVAEPRRYMRYANVACLAAIGYLGFQLFTGLQNHMALEDKFKGVTQQKAVIEQAFQDELANKEAMGFDVVLIRKALKVYGNLEEGSLKPLPLMRDIGKALGPNLRIDNIRITTSKKEVAIDQYDPSTGQQVIKNKTHFEAVFTLSFPRSINPEIGVDQINKLVGRLRKGMPDYDTELLKQVADLSYTGNFIGESGSIRRDTGSSQDYEAEIMVSGVM